MSQIINCSDVAKAFGSQEVLDGIQWQINDRIRCALVGRNGTGKTTLFRMFLGEVEPDRGALNIRKGAVIASMEQDLWATDGRTLREEAARGLEHLKELEAEFTTVTEELGGLKEGDPKSSDLLDRYAYLEERLRSEGAYTADSRVRAVLDGLHFRETDLDRPLAEFSGGQKNRAALARVLLQDPDLLLLDEPTNHLDLDAIEWLESFLSSYQGAYILVSHDRVFLNRLIRDVAELRDGKLNFYQGNYDDFLAERERRLEDHARLYELQRQEIRKAEVFIQKNITRASTTKRAQSRRNKLERMERIPPPEWPASSIHMSLPEPSRSAKNVIEAKKLGKAYGDVRVFSGLDFLVLRGQKIGLVGPNGVGKTTLLRLLVGEESQTEGTLKFGPEVELGYYEQEQIKLRGKQSILDEVWSITPSATEGEMRTFLGAFLFRGEDVFKSLNQLSGGERSRVALAKLVRGDANLLIFDEPTNHLDLESRTVMEKALEAYRGTLLVASHDRALLSQVVDSVLEIRADEAKLYEEGYEAFSRSRHKAVEPPPAAKPRGTKVAAAPAKSGAESAKQPDPPSKQERKESYQESRRRKRDEEKLRKRVAQAEEAVMGLEQRRESVQTSMLDPELATASGKLAELAADLREIERELQKTISEWERLAGRLDAFLDGASS